MPAGQADNAHDQRLRTLYDAANRAIAIVDGVGGLTVQRFDANGNLLARTDYATPADPDLALNMATIAAAAARITDAATDHRAVYRYDAANRRSWSADGTGAVLRYLYDGSCANRCSTPTAWRFPPATAGTAAASS